MARRGQGRDAAGAVEQLHAQVGFQVADGRADRRLGAPQSSRCGRKRAGLNGADEHLQLLQRKAHHLILSTGRSIDSNDG